MNNNFFDLIKNAGEAASEAIKSGLDVRDKDETEKCLTICSECENLKSDPFRCGICGCYLKLKVKLKAWHCPLNKW